LDIPLSDFTNLTTRAALAQYILVGQPTGATTVYIDNFYFYDDAGSGGGGVPTPTDNPPTVGITSPTSATSYTSSENAITISGTAADDKLITGIKWANSSGGSGNAIDSAGNWSKFFADITKYFYHHVLS